MCSYLFLVRGSLGVNCSGLSRILARFITELRFCRQLHILLVANATQPKLACWLMNFLHIHDQYLCQICFFPTYNAQLIGIPPQISYSNLWKQHHIPTITKTYQPIFETADTHVNRLLCHHIRCEQTIPLSFPTIQGR